MNFYIVPAIVLAFVLNGFYWYQYGGHTATEACENRVEIERATATGLARTLEQQQQQKTNQALKVQNEQLTQINTRLHRDLSGLRQRAARDLTLSDAARVACAGSTGAELSKEDGEFLVREAARADELRNGLETCYAVIEAVK